MKRVFITGINGFTGRHLAPLLSKMGFEVTGLGPVQANGQTKADWVVYPGSLEDREGLKSILEAIRPDFVVHLAGIAFVAHDDAALVYRTNLIGSRNLLAAIEESGSQVSRVLLASSANIYGNHTGGKLDEASKPHPASDYAISKFAMELVAATFANRLPVTIARPFNYTGLGQSIQFVIPKIIDHARRRATHLELGNLDVRRDFSDVRMVVECYARLLEQPGAIGQTVNVCSARSTSLRDVIAMVERLAGLTFEIEVNPEFVRANEVHELYGSMDRFRAICGEVVVPPLEQTLEWMLKA